MTFRLRYVRGSPIVTAWRSMNTCLRNFAAHVTSTENRTIISVKSAEKNSALPRSVAIDGPASVVRSNTARMLVASALIAVAAAAPTLLSCSVTVESGELHGYHREADAETASPSSTPTPVAAAKGH
jgi:hypothetical protein